MNLRAGQTVQIVKLHRCQRSAELFEFARRFVQLSTFVIGTDNEHAHVVLARSLDRPPIEVIHEVPMNIDVIESSTVHSLKNNISRRMSGKPDKSDAALLLQLASSLQTSFRLQRMVQQFAIINPMQRQQIDIVQ